MHKGKVGKIATWDFYKALKSRCLLPPRSEEKGGFLCDKHDKSREKKRSLCGSRWACYAGAGCQSGEAAWVGKAKPRLAFSAQSAHLLLLPNQCYQPTAFLVLLAQQCYQPTSITSQIVSQAFLCFWPVLSVQSARLLPANQCVANLLVLSVFYQSTFRSRPKYILTDSRWLSLDLLYMFSLPGNTSFLTCVTPMHQCERSTSTSFPQLPVALFSWLALLTISFLTQLFLLRPPQQFKLGYQFCWLSDLSISFNAQFAQMQSNMSLLVLVLYVLHTSTLFAISCSNRQLSNSLWSEGSPGGQCSTPAQFIQRKEPD